MRASIILTALALMVAGCGKNDGGGNAATGDQGLTAENFVANDVTAIDAVTADAANMAADVQINFTNEVADTNDTTANRSAKAPPKTAQKAPVRAATAPASQAAESPAANATANANE